MAHPWSSEARREPSRRARTELEFDEPTVLGALFGQFDSNLVLIENRLGVYIAARGNKIQIEGGEDAVGRARDVLKGMHQRLMSGQELDSGAVESLIAMSNEPTLEGIISGGSEAPPVMIRTRRKTIVPRSATQIEYMRALAKSDVIFALGPAGTGKTYVAVAQAVSQLMNGSVQRLILSRPAVEAGERLGFLPGDMKDKVDPYLRPLYDALYDCMPPEQVERRLASGEIEVAPIAFMRGRTLADAFVILDEAQNTTPAQMKMFPDPLWPEQPDGDLRRSAAGGHSRRRFDERPGRRGQAAGRDRRHRHDPLQRRRRGAPPDRRADRGGLRGQGRVAVRVAPSAKLSTCFDRLRLSGPLRL